MPAGSYSTIGAVAERINIPRWRLAYLIERGDVPGPSLQVPGRRLFSQEDIDRIREALEDGRDRSTGEKMNSKGEQRPANDSARSG
jgi:DNA-binding transcriptional MerR regulator